MKEDPPNFVLGLATPARFAVGQRSPMELYIHSRPNCTFVRCDLSTDASRVAQRSRNEVRELDVPSEPGYLAPESLKGPSPYRLASQPPQPSASSSAERRSKETPGVFNGG